MDGADAQLHGIKNRPIQTAPRVLVVPAVQVDRIVGVKGDRSSTRHINKANSPNRASHQLTPSLHIGAKVLPSQKRHTPRADACEHPQPRRRRR